MVIGRSDEAELMSLTKSFVYHVAGIAGAHVVVVGIVGVFTHGTATVSYTHLTYLGEAGDEEYPGLAVKVVTSDMYDSDEAKINTLTGVAVSLGEGTLDLETPDGNIFNFVEAGADFSMTSEGDKVTIIYEGSLGGHEIKAVGME